jgi:hypothetical protein
MVLHCSRSSIAGHSYTLILGYSACLSNPSAKNLLYRPNMQSTIPPLHLAMLHWMQNFTKFGDTNMGSSYHWIFDPTKFPGPLTDE